jgi:hypothetical protein
MYILIFAPYGRWGHLVWGKILTRVVGTICPPGKPYSENSSFLQTTICLRLGKGRSSFVVNLEVTFVARGAKFHRLSWRSRHWYGLWGQHLPKEYVII